MASTAIGLPIAGGLARTMLGGGAADRARIWTYWSSGSEAAALNALLDVAAERYPDMRLENRTVAGGVVGLRQAMQVSLLGGNPPTLFQGGMGLDLQGFVNAGRLIPLDATFAGPNSPDRFPEGIRRVITFGGRLYGVPLNIHILSNVFYNRRIFAKLGLRPPRGWQEFAHICSVLQAAGYAPIANAGGPSWTMGHLANALVSTCGRDNYFALASGNRSFQSPAVRQAFEIIGNVYAPHYSRGWSGYSWNEAADQFVDGRVAMYQMGDWLSSYFTRAGLAAGADFGAFPAPSLPNSIVITFDVLAQTSGQPEAFATAGQQLLAAAISPEGQQAFNLKKGSVAANENTPSDGYDLYGRMAYRQVRAATAAGNVIPNIKNLLPVVLGDELGTRIFAFAMAPTAGSLTRLLGDMDAMRQDLREQSAFAQW